MPVAVVVNTSFLACLQAVNMAGIYILNISTGYQQHLNFKTSISKI